MTSQEKTKFRQTKKWKDFCDNLIKERGQVCELTGRKLTRKQCQVHHKRPDEYDVLLPERFKILSPTSHDVIEWAAIMMRGGVPNQEAWQDLFGDFIPVTERKTDKYYAMLDKPTDKV